MKTKRWLICIMVGTMLCLNNGCSTTTAQSVSTTQTSEDESILETAKRELQEETGAVDFRIEPICVYSVKGKTRVNENIDDETFGMLFIADINSFEELHSEIEKILISDKLVENWTYPLIQPILIEEAKKLGFKRCIVPAVSMKTIGKMEGIEILGVENVNQAMNLV